MAAAAQLLGQLGTVAGINIYTGTLGLDVEDAHAANAAVLKYQIGRGRFREAVATARQAVAISTAYEQKVRRALDIARRDVAQVNWVSEILTTLDEAREHLRTRIDADNEILAAVEEHGEEAEPHERMHVADLEKHIHSCQSRHSALHADARARGFGETTQTLLYLLALRYYGEAEENVEYVVKPAVQCFIVEPYWGDDLLICPPAKSAEETA